MSKDYEIQVKGHKSIYAKEAESDTNASRKIKIYFSTPSYEMNDDTGVLLLISGFGASTNSKVYKKMRKEFADKYNLVTIQCDYFGNEFMQTEFLSGNYSLQQIDLNKMKNSLSEEDYSRMFDEGALVLTQLLDVNFTQENTIVLKKIQNESIHNFNDMGIMQAIDNITAVLTVLAIIYNNNVKINTKKIIAMGQSHGSYLGYLSNRLCPNLFHYILDNSAWVYPSYIDGGRSLVRKNGNLTIVTNYEYFAKKNNISFKFLDLKRMYQNFNNQCKIVCYHGAEDPLITLENKQSAVKDIENLVFNKITPEKVDGKVFTNCVHGLGADFLNLFDTFYKSYVEPEKSKGDTLEFDNYVEFQQLSIDYTSGLPVVELRNS
ncbi:DUF2920 family protein [Clostridium cellulovorans]|uniref:DUF2920 family protein n=1 Tax=Clostridium cellulovorans (strain ATCC 35296 / DSM 3052 / OCM 3 / 743B) TaxID=573061 RepID=D9SU27_CLOC7|nr:DUF2920 family protein [Clostridium cellulovorans]ADL50865.1 hypothetical protein Clocel_1106 [Clostridium cellulovorans 743B]